MTKGRRDVAALTINPIRAMAKMPTATMAASRMVHPKAESVGVWYLGSDRGAMA